jgi:hypothetical protein
LILLGDERVPAEEVLQLGLALFDGPLAATAATTRPDEHRQLRSAAVVVVDTPHVPICIHIKYQDTVRKIME